MEHNYQKLFAEIDGILRRDYAGMDECDGLFDPRYYTQAIGQVVLANFANPTGLRQLGNSYWSPTGVSGDAKLGSAGTGGFGNLMSGTIERSNVDITEELVGLIAAQRNFQANAKAIDTATQLSQTIINIRS